MSAGLGRGCDSRHNLGKLSAEAGWCRNLVRTRSRAEGGFRVDQFNAAEGIAGHETTTGPEILGQFGGPVDGWVAAVSTGCTFLGIAWALKAANPASLCAAVEPGQRTIGGRGNR